MNVLLTSVGRRTYLVDYFRSALRGSGMVIGTNMYGDSPAMYSADIAVVTPPASHADYVPALLETCRRYNVGLLCSLHDIDTFVLSQHRDQFETAGVRTTLPDSDWGRITLDKYECTLLLRDHGFSVPKTTVSLGECRDQLSTGSLSFPLIVKARAGYGSMGLRICADHRELSSAYNDVIQATRIADSKARFSMSHAQPVLIQEYIHGREICIGICNDLGGRYRAHFACEIEAMRAGESDSATSLDPTIAGDLPVRLAAMTRHSGIWGIDCIDRNGALHVVDINPRFSGDYPFHHLAGADVPRALITWARGETPDGQCFETKAGVRAYKDLVPTVAAALPAGQAPYRGAPSSE